MDVSAGYSAQQPPVPRPQDLFDREQEWADLVSFATRPARAGAPRIELALVWGRRRQGKSYLLRRLAQATGGFYYQALEESPQQALDGMGAAAGAHAQVPGGKVSFATWDEALRALAALPPAAAGTLPTPFGLGPASSLSAAPLSPFGTELPGGTGLPGGTASPGAALGSSTDASAKPLVVVLDEFPYLLTHSPQLPSAIQRLIDASRDTASMRPVRLVLCGSSLSVMASLLVGHKALRGRAGHNLILGGFDFRTSARYWEIEDPATAFLVNAVLGGTPGYRDLVSAPPPSDAADFPRWLEQAVLNPASALFYENDYLLAEERTLSDRALYHATLTAIARGATKQGAVAAALGREKSAIQHPLKALQDAGFISRHDDVLLEKRPTYQIADPIVRFHQVVTRPDLARFEDRRFTQAWADAVPRFSAGVLGPHFEQLARDFTARYADPGTTGGAASAVGTAVLSDAKSHSQKEIDVVAQTVTETGAKAVIAIGEAKHTAQPRSTSDLTRLEEIRDLLIARNQATADIKLLLFSANGFDTNLMTSASKREDVELIDLERLYHGH